MFTYLRDPKNAGTSEQNYLNQTRRYGKYSEIEAKLE